jgi:hypothetical protein
MNDREYKWCLKCNRGNGQWVQAHMTETHQEDFHIQRHFTNTPKTTTGILKGGTPSSKTRVSFAIQEQTTPPPVEHSAQLSLTEGLENCFRFDVDDLTGND